MGIRIVLYLLYCALQIMFLVYLCCRQFESMEAKASDLFGYEEASDRDDVERLMEIQRGK